MSLFCPILDELTRVQNLSLGFPHISFEATYSAHVGTLFTGCLCIQATEHTLNIT